MNEQEKRMLEGLRYLQYPKVVCRSCGRKVASRTKRSPLMPRPHLCAGGA